MHKTTDTSPTEPSKEPAPAAGVESPEAPSREWSGWRLLLLVVVLLCMAGVAKWLGWEQFLRPKTFKASMQGAGVLGVCLYLGLFAISGLFQLPGMVLVVTGTFVYGKVAGFLLALVGGTLAVNVQFQFVRLVGGQALGGVRRPWVQKMLLRLEERPILTQVVLRVPLPLSPPLNTLLALTRLSWGAYFLGSLLGLLGPLLVVVSCSHWVLGWLGL